MRIRAQDTSEARDLHNLTDVVDFNPNLDRTLLELPLGQASYFDSETLWHQLGEGEQAEFSCKFTCHYWLPSTLR
jgi:hypothetical protein